MAEEKVNCFGKARHLLEKFLRDYYAPVIVKYPWVFIIVCLIICGGLAVGMIHHPYRLVTDHVYLFTPITGRSYYEEAAIAERSWGPIKSKTETATEDYKQSATAIFYGRNEGDDLMTIDFMNGVIEFNEYVMNEIWIQPPNESLPEANFKDICLTWTKNRCTTDNKHANIIKFYLRYENETDERLTYPKLRPPGDGVPIYIGNALGGVETFPNSERVKAFKAIFTIYTFDRAKFLFLQERWEEKFRAYAKRFDETNKYGLRVAYTDSVAVRDGLILAEEEIRPRISITFCLLFFFCVVSNLRFTKNTPAAKCCCNLCSCVYTLDKPSSKPFLSCVGIVSASMGIVSSMGLFLLSGSVYDNTVTVMPFLVVSIGVDDMFIMVSAWRRTDPRLSVLERMQDAMEESFVSVTITSITSAVSFAVGMFAPMRAVIIFCKYTSLGILFNYLYQVTFFAACMAISGKMEKTDSWLICDDCVKRLKAKKNDEKVEAAVTASNGAPMVSRKLSERDTRPWMVKQLEDKIAPAILSSKARPFIIILFLVYIAAGIYGCYIMKNEFRVQKIFPPGFYGAAYVTALSKYFWTSGLQVDILVGICPNLTLAENRNEIEKLIASFENTQHSMGREATQVWYREFKKFADPNTQAYEEPETWSRVLLDWTDFSYIRFQYEKDLQWRPSTAEEKKYCKCDKVVEAFKFRIGMKNFEEQANQVRAVKIFRGIADGWPQYNVSTWFYDWPYMDQYTTILPSTAQNVGLAIVCMIIIAIIFVPDVTCIICISLTVVSIDIGIFGFLALWNIDLDSISMITILMSIGLSVDYTAHVAYAYMVSEQSSPERKAQEAIGNVGLPVFQGAFSTLLGTLALATVETYIGQVFFRTVVLVITLGILHACCFLPVMLIAVDKLFTKFKANACCTSCSNCCGKRSARNTAAVADVDMPTTTVSET